MEPNIFRFLTIT